MLLTTHSSGKLKDIKPWIHPTQVRLALQDSTGCLYTQRKTSRKNPACTSEPLMHRKELCSRAVWKRVINGKYQPVNYSWIICYDYYSFSSLHFPIDYKVSCLERFRISQTLGKAASPPHCWMCYPKSHLEYDHNNLIVIPKISKHPH